MLGFLITIGLDCIKTLEEDYARQQFQIPALLSKLTSSDTRVSDEPLDTVGSVDGLPEDRKVKYLRIRTDEGEFLAFPKSSITTVLNDQVQVSGDVAIDVNALTQASIDPDKLSIGAIEVADRSNNPSLVVLEAGNWMVAIAMIELVIVCALLMIVGRFLSEYLTKFSKAFRSIEENDLYYELNVNNGGQIGECAKSLSRMIIYLRKYRTTLQTAMREIELKHNASEVRLTALLEAVPHGVAIVGRDGYLNCMNNNYINTYNLPFKKNVPNLSFFTVADLQSRVIKELPYAGPSRTESVESTRQTRLKLFEKSEQFPRWQVLLNDNSLITCIQKKTTDGETILIDVDVTSLFLLERKATQLERDLVQKQRLESLGMLTSGVSHEIITPIQFLSNNLSFMSDVFNGFSSCIDALEKEMNKINKQHIFREACSAFDVTYLTEEGRCAIDQSIVGIEHVQNLLSAISVYTHPDNYSFHPVDINRVLKSAALVCNAKYETVCALDISLEEGLPLVRGNESQLMQVFINLITNSVDAFIECSNPDTGRKNDRKIRITSAFDSTRIVTSISDNGSGIPNSIQEKIFDPFFTTKKPGKGTGQGLAICRSIICDGHNGDLRFETSAADGTVFYVYLPIAKN